jgi:hypothetical protein
MNRPAGFLGDRSLECGAGQGSPHHAKAIADNMQTIETCDPEFAKVYLPEKKAMMEVL